ncbi:SDR family NAD(P)-dependent oxidoreductase [Terrabacter terrae]|uniref:SDR family NAD(P)-dependent oxidoreductase n=1 Tax=Terrabacter terrae TaxID=318434 RepID=A0ABN2UQ95_9MICO
MSETIQTDTDGAEGPTSPAPLAVVTGASSGIGLQLAAELARRGHDLVVCADEPAITDAADALRESGREVVPVRADLATTAGVEQLVTSVVALGRPVDVLALNAGVGVSGPFVDTPLEDDLRLVELNVTSVVHAAKFLLPAMVRRGRGAVLVTSSVAATMPGPWYATYAASKAFLLSFAEAIRYELDGTGVTVTALMPGPTDTEFFQRAGAQRTVVDDMPKDDPADVARDGVDALLRGDDHVVAHAWRNKVQAGLLKGLPETAKAAVHARLSKVKGTDPDDGGQQRG